MIETLRFFRVVGLLQPVMALAFSLAVTVDAATLLMNGTHTASSLAPLFLLQAFASSTGFLVPARRGQYDMLLTSGHHRFGIGVVHWVVSVAPGVVAWLLLALIEQAITGGTAIALAGGTVVVMLLISTLPWAATVPLPRLGGGFAWLTVVVLVMSMFSQPGRDPLLMEDGRGPIARTVTVLICPWLLAGRGLTGNDVIPGAFAVAIGAISIACGLYWIHRADIPLETAQ